MSATRTDYLTVLRDRIADSFDMEGLRLLTADLHVRWDELRGERLTPRVQDLVTQLAQQGRLEELVAALEQQRPHVTWPAVPPPAQQQQDIRTAFPARPLYQQTWIWALSIVLLGLVGLGLAAQLPDRIARAIPTATAAAPPTATAIATSTPLPFAPATADETLIVVATFYHTEGVVDVATQNEIRRAIQAQVDTLELANVRVEVEPTVLRSEDRAAAEALGELYDATLIIWGSDTGVRLEVNFLNRKQTAYASVADTTISETTKTQLANPDKYSQFVVDELPSQLSYLSLFALGQSKYSSSNYLETIPLIESGIAALPALSGAQMLALGLDDAHFYLGTAYYFSDRLEAALPYYSATIDLNPTYLHAYNNRGVLFNARGSYEEALTDFEEAIEIDPDYGNVYINRGITYIHQMQYDRALQDFNRAIALNAQSLEAYFNRSVVLNIVGQYESAIADLDRAIALNPQEPLAYVNRGTAYSILGQYDLALDDFGHGLELDPNNPKAYVSRGLTYSSLGQHEEALADHGRAIALDPAYREAYNARGLAHSALSQYEEALADYNRAIELDPEHADAYYNRGAIYNELGDYARALADFDKTIALDPDFTDAYYDRGFAHQSLGQTEKALSDYSQVIARDPAHARAYLGRGLTYLILGDSEKALPDLRRYLELEPESPLQAELQEILTLLETELEN